MSHGEFQPKNQSEEVLRRCGNKGSTGKVPIIDVDDGKVEFVTVNGVEFSHKISGRFKQLASKRNSPISNYINIDDEESIHGNEEERDHHNVSCTPPSSSSSHVCDGNDDDESVIFVKEGKTSQEDLSEKTNFGSCSGRDFPIFHEVFMNGKPIGESFDLSSSESDMFENDENDTGTSDSDSSDCEIIDGSSVNVCEEWQKAASEKGNQNRTGNVSEGHVTASESSSESRNAFFGTDLGDDACSSFSCGRKFDYENLPFKSHMQNAQTSFDSHDFFRYTFRSQDGVSFPSHNYNHATSFEEKEEASSEIPSRRENPDVCNEEHAQSSFGYKNAELERNDMCEQKEASVSHHGFHMKSSETSKNDPLVGGAVSAVRDSMGAANLEGTNMFKQKEGVSQKEIPEPQDDIQKKSQETCKSDPLVKGTNDVNVLLHSKGVDSDHRSEKSLIGDREKHKESEEYRRAADGEWAARQEQLRIQAEEARRMRKRKKAENLRLQDMEKRQKQRLEEVRESQKKNEETISLKEQLRAEISKQLDLMEFRYRDMASLLRALGVEVGGGRSPSPQEVNSAYKQALLKFHPDRASRTDVRLQVEAEEKFKLISRLKGRLLLKAR